MTDLEKDVLLALVRRCLRLIDTQRRLIDDQQKHIANLSVDPEEITSDGSKWLN